jgi:hypothetical protein
MQYGFVALELVLHLAENKEAVSQFDCVLDMGVQAACMALYSEVELEVYQCNWFASPVKV